MENIPSEVIIVEGRDDTKRLIETFGNQVKTIETNGSALDKQILDRIVKADQEYGVIVFTDPDYPGLRIRRMIREAIPDVKEAFLSQAQTISNRKHASLGIEHASKEDIRLALSQVMTPPRETHLEMISLSHLIELKLVGSPHSKTLRQKVAKQFNLGYLNAKQLQKQLYKYGITQKELDSYLKEGE